MQSSACIVPARCARWYLVHTRPNGERKAVFNLDAQGFVTFLPQIEKTIRHARRLKAVRRPLFPRYVFVKFDIARDRWTSIYGTIGVAGLLSHAGRPIPVPIGIVEGLLARREEGITRLDLGLTPGRRVRILSGPFADFTATLTRLDASRRVEVLLEMMGTAVSVTVDRQVLAPAA